MIVPIRTLFHTLKIQHKLFSLARDQIVSKLCLVDIHKIDDIENNYNNADNKLTDTVLYDLDIQLWIGGKDILRNLRVILRTLFIDSTFKPTPVISWMICEKDYQPKDCQFANNIHNIPDQRPCKIFGQVKLFVAYWINLTIIHSPKS